MKVELKDAKVELEVKNGMSKLYINGHCIELPKVVGIKLIFGDEVGIEFPDPPKKEKKRGCQSPASKRKLSTSLKKYHAKQRRAANATTKPAVVKPAAPVVTKPPIKKVVPKHLNGKSYLNGSSPHP